MSLLRNRRAIVAATSTVAVLAIVAGMMLATGSLNPAVAFAPAGHWVANRAENSVVHVDSGTGQVDARVAAPGAARDALLTVQGQSQGFLVGRDTITTFGKSSLTVESSFPTGQTEVPYAIETLGGPYLVYRTAGTIVRLGETPTSIAVGGTVDRPVNTDDGTVWIHRPDDGSVCSLTSAQAALGCPVNTRPGNAGALTVLSGVAEFLDTGADAFQSLTGTSTGTPAGVDLPEGALVADRDTQGRLPVLVPAGNRLLLLDTSGAPQGRAGGAPLTIELGAGAFTSPAAADGIVAIVEQTQNVLLTFRIDGTKISSIQLPPGEPSILTRGGDGRLYIDDANGSTTHIVNPDGSVTSVETGGVVAVGAPPADQIETVSLPDLPSGPPRTSGGPGNVQGPDDGPPQPGTPPPPPEVPLTPTGVTASQSSAGVVVSWSGTSDPSVTYVVRASTGEELRSARQTVSFSGLPAGSTVTFTVVAASSAGSSPPSSPSSPLLIRAGAPGAPTGLVLTSGRYTGSNQEQVLLEPRWNQPDLNGGELVEYQIIEKSPWTRSPAQFTSPVPYLNGFGGYRCLMPFTIEVRAVTRTPGSTERLVGPAAIAKSVSEDCTVRMSISPGAVTATSATVLLTNIPRSNYSSGECDLLFNGVAQWRGQCGGAASASQAVVTGLDPSTNYRVVLQISQTWSEVSASKPTTSNTISIATPAS